MNNYQIEGEQRNATTHIALFTIPHFRNSFILS